MMNTELCGTANKGEGEVESGSCVWRTSNVAIIFHFFKKKMYRKQMSYVRYAKAQWCVFFIVSILLHMLK